MALSRYRILDLSSTSIHLDSEVSWSSRSSSSYDASFSYDRKDTSRARYCPISVRIRSLGFARPVTGLLRLGASARTTTTPKSSMNQQGYGSGNTGGAAASREGSRRDRSESRVRGGTGRAPGAAGEEEKSCRDGPPRGTRTWAAVTRDFVAHGDPPPPGRRRGLRWKGPAVHARRESRVPGGACCSYSPPYESMSSA